MEKRIHEEWSLKEPFYLDPEKTSGNFWKI